LAGLQILIAATGNYGFFNLLAVVDSLWLLDDQPIARALRLRTPPAERAPWWRRLAVGIAALPLFLLTGAELVTRLWRRAKVPRSLTRLHRAFAPFHAVSSYGLFAVMTTERPEIVIEGSMDGISWREYRFRYKPDDVRKPPRIAAPHQPRLDWQMWFAALGPPPVWFGNLMGRLLEGSPDVLRLFEHDPFPEHPPTYVREVRGLYFPPVMLGSHLDDLQSSAPA
jgi:lipase maturation factor 1